MGISKRIQEVDEHLQKTNDRIEELEEHSVAMGVLKICKDQQKMSTESLMHTNRRLVWVILVISLFWFATICGFTYYITHYTTETITETADTTDGGNACIGDNCYNGDISYGKSEKN